MNDDVPHEIIAKAKHWRSGINSSSYQEYFCYHHGDDHMTLDGGFSAAELRALADYIDKHKKQETTT